MLDLSIVVPVRNAEDTIEECLDSIVHAEPREIIVVDGLSTDKTMGIARRYPVRILSDEGRGLPAARMLGARAATSRWVALIDADVVLPDGALAALLEEFNENGYTGLQAGLESSSGPGYWGRALVHHHRSGRSKNWFGVVATIFERETLLRYGFDDRFLSGEDWELRWRLERAGAKVGVSRQTVVDHRFGDDFAFAQGQWLADGHGLARLIDKQGWHAAHLVGLPLAASARGIGLSLIGRQPRWVPYYLCYGAFNYLGMLMELFGGLKRRGSRKRRPKEHEREALPDEAP
jgi:glycosyltransferase involved in cell wall biosynthesis